VAAKLTFDFEDAMTVVPRRAVTFPLRFAAPAEFVVDDPRTWPEVEGRLEYVNGRLEFMPPCGRFQQRVTVDVTTELNLWCRSTPGYIVGGNEAGMKLGDDVRGADAAIWRATGEAADHTFERTAPLLAVEVMGRDDTLAILEEKAAWYLAHGVETVWIVDPEKRQAYVVAHSGKTTAHERMPEPSSLPGLVPLVASFFRQL